MRIPANAKQVFHGIIFDVYHWQQKMFDGTTETFEMIKRRPSTDVIATVKNKIMVLIQEQPTRKPYYSLPGGMLEKKENHSAAARRELLEETGQSSNCWLLLGEWRGYSKERFHECVFIARNCRKTAEPKLDSGERIRTEYFSFDDFLQLCRDSSFAIPYGLRLVMYEALLDARKREELAKKIFG